MRSFPFQIQKMILERSTISDAINYLQGRAQRGAHGSGRPPPVVRREGGDARRAWRVVDATGDYGKHLSHLSFSTYFNPQQIPLVAYSLFKSYELMNARAVPSFARYKTRALDEADYVRRRLPGALEESAGDRFTGRSRTAAWTKNAEERKVSGEMKKYGIFQSKDKAPTDMVQQASNDREYEVSYRSGGGMAIAVLARWRAAIRSPVSSRMRIISRRPRTASRISRRTQRAA